MLIREILPEEKDRYNQVAGHPLQSYEWGEFRKKMGLTVVRLGMFNAGKLVTGFQFTIHNVPLLGIKVGYLPKGPKLNKETLDAVSEACRSHRCAFIKIEPNVETGTDTETEEVLKSYPGIAKATHSLFTKYTFYLDLTKSEDELLFQMKEKTRYNVRLAQKKGVTVQEENTPEVFNNYLNLLRETAKRDKFFAHDPKYHQQMWEVLSPAGIAKLLTARFENQILVAWVLFVWKNFLYYSYGSSSSEHREVMASNLVYFEAAKLGKKMGLTTFDLWGALGPNPNSSDPFYGFHRFKEGYGGKLVEFVGSYDLVLNKPLYDIFHKMDSWRWKLLNLRQILPF